VAATAWTHKVSKQTICSWRKHFGELSPREVMRLRALEGENARLKKLLLERDLRTQGNRSIENGEPAGRGLAGDQSDEAAVVSILALRLPAHPPLPEVTGVPARLVSRTGSREAGNWRPHFNAIRPQSSLNYFTLLTFKQQHHSTPDRAIL